jgi:hypothetical protein
MRLKLPPAPPSYNAAYDDQRNRLIEAFAANTYQKGDDVGVYQPAKLIVSDTNFITTDTHSPEEGSVSWNELDGTLDLGMDNGVIQQIGLDTYARVENMTGATIAKGSVVGFVGVGANNTLRVAKFLADGTSNSLYMLGVMAHDLPDSGQVGYCQIWGHIKNVNTSAFAVGDILYASPTTAGAFTKTKPTAPNNVIPVAAVLKVGTADGEIFIRPTIEQQDYYGVFSDTATKTPAAIYTPYGITFNTTDYAKGFSRGSPTSRIVAAASGLYNFQFSAQISSGSSSAKKIWIWPRINGVDVANSNSEVTVAANNSAEVIAWNWVLSLNANDYFEIMYAVDDTNVQIVASAAQTGATGTASFARPAVPSIILTVTQVQQ